MKGGCLVVSVQIATGRRGLVLLLFRNNFSFKCVGYRDLATALLRIVAYSAPNVSADGMLRPPDLQFLLPNPLGTVLVCALIGVCELSEIGRG